MDCEPQKVNSEWVSVYNSRFEKSKSSNEGRLLVVMMVHAGMPTQHQVYCQLIEEEDMAELTGCARGRDAHFLNTGIHLETEQ